jgi:hypothetical protein
LIVTNPNFAGPTERMESTNTNPKVVIIPTSEELLREAAPLTAAAREAVREALTVHKKLGNSIAVWRDGKVVIVPPEEIVIDPPSNGDSAGSST